MTTLPGDLVSPVAGWLLRRGAPVLVRLHPQPIQGLVDHDGYGWVALTMRDGMFLSIDGGSFLFDLSDPAGMDIAARWLAAHHGLSRGSGVSDGWSWWRWTPSGGGWALGCGPDPVPDCLCLHSGDLMAVTDIGRQTWVAVPGISAMTDPAEALRLACLAAVGRAG